MKKYLTLCVAAFSAAAAMAAAPDEGAVRRAKEQLLRFTPAAARRAMADLKSNPKYDYAKYNPAVEALIAKLDETKAALNGEDDVAKAAAVARVEAYRQAMLANPILDFDKILCVHRKINGARGAFGGAAVVKRAGVVEILDVRQPVREAEGDLRERSRKAARRQPQGI